MPLSMPNPSSRMTANPARPVTRYRPGKAIAEASSSEEGDSDEDEKDAENQTSPRKQTLPKATSFPASQRARQVHHQDHSKDEEGFVTDDEDDGNNCQMQPSSQYPSKGAPKPSTGDSSTTDQTIEHQGQATQRQLGKLKEDDSASTDEEDEDSSDEDEDEEEAPQRTFQRPTFIKISERGQATQLKSSILGANGLISTASNPDTATGEEARRKEMADLMIKETLERNAATRAAGRKGWDDDDEVAPEDVIDDTDGIDPEAEYAAWKLRELQRLKRDREMMEQREKEIEEVERRRNLTQTERETEDREFLERQKEERGEGKGKAGFLQQYHHKGAFFQDDETAEILRRRDLMGAKFVDEVKNRDALPKYMQVRDMTKLGKKGKTRYIDLRGEDTGRWGQGYDHTERRGPKMPSDVDERFRPDHDGAGVKGPTGANAAMIQDRSAPNRPRNMQNGESSQDAHGQDKSYRVKRISIERSDDSGDTREGQRSFPARRQLSLSGSRSPNRKRYGDSYSYENGTSSSGKRSMSSQPDRDKRRRVET